MRRLCLSLCAAVLCLFLSGCWEADIPAEAEDFWDYTPEETVSSSEIVTRASVFTLPFLSSQTMDPITCSDGAQQVVGSLLYEGLFALDEHFEPQPVLCSRVDRSEDGLTYTFYLREGVAFTNGDALTPSDVTAAYRRAQISERYSARFANVASMRAGRGAVVISLIQPDSAFPALLDIPIVQSGTEKDTTPLGTGPYLFQTDDSGPCLVRNEAWWNGTAPLPRIELASAKDADTAVYLFSAQSAHLLTADLLSPTTAASVGGADMTDAPTTSLLYLGINTSAAPLSDPALRRAMGLGLDRGTIAATLLAGHAQEAQFPISPASSLYPVSADIPYTAGAYAAALAQLRGEDGAETTDLTLLVNEENGFKTALAEYLARQLSIGQFRVTPEILPWNEYLDRLESRQFDLFLGELRLTPDWNITSLVGTGGALNFARFSDSETDAALRAFLREETPATAAALCQRLSEQTPILPLAFKSLSVLTTERLIDGISPTAAQPLRNLGQWTFHFYS